MSTVKYITERNEAATLARRLNQGSYERPIVVVTIPAGRETSWIDADSIADEAGDLAEIHVMPTGPLTWEFSNLMSEGTQVYGGAGRVYPVGREWIRALARSPLRFAFNELDGQ